MKIKIFSAQQLNLGNELSLLLKNKYSLVYWYKECLQKIHIAKVTENTQCKDKKLCSMNPFV